jgi:hypothetical protein
MKLIKFHSINRSSIFIKFLYFVFYAGSWTKYGQSGAEKYIEILAQKIYINENQGKKSKIQ